MDADVVVRTWIVDVLQAHPQVMRIALRQRAKFEGWLKFELAAFAENSGMMCVAVEASTDDSSSCRGDISFSHDSIRHHIELKTCNANWQIAGVFSPHRPVTKNLAGIAKDTEKLQGCNGIGIVAACIFPIPANDIRWHKYVDSLSEQTQLPISAERNATTVRLAVNEVTNAEIAVLTFLANPRACDGNPQITREDKNLGPTWVQ